MNLEYMKVTLFEISKKTNKSRYSDFLNAPVCFLFSVTLKEKKMLKWSGINALSRPDLSVIFIDAVVLISWCRVY